MQLDLRRRLEQILSAPTAPFFEHEVHRRLLDAADERGLRAREDRWGNLELVYGPGRPRLLFACHTDHPGLLAGGDGTARIQGGIRIKELVGHGLLTLDGASRVEVTGVVRGSKDSVRLGRGGKDLKRGSPLILDMPALSITKTHVRARAIDDLCAAACCLATVDRLAHARWKGTVGFLFTRAEEVGFAGALGWVRTTKLPKTTTIINLEMSTALPHTPQGKGPILRVGDRVSIFSRDVSLGLMAAAKAAGIEHQRALMSGGGCEATVFGHAGFVAGALCLPLKNTHNHKPRGGIGPEFVQVDDVESLVAWMVRYARDFGKKEPAQKLDRALEKLFRKHRRRLEGSA